MDSMRDLPPELWSICDALIESVIKKSPPPPNVSELHNWLEDDGWDALVGAQSGGEVVLDISGLGLEDVELRSVRNISSRKKITDLMRIEYGRERVKDVVESAYDVDHPTVHCCKMERKDGESAVIGAILATQGVGWGVVAWCGAFSDSEQFHKTLKKNGLYFPDDFYEISDAKILAMWTKKVSA